MTSMCKTKSTKWVIYSKIEMAKYVFKVKKNKVTDKAGCGVA